MCFPKGISTYTRTSYDVPKTFVHLVILHSNTVQSMLVVALACFCIQTFLLKVLFKPVWVDGQPKSSRNIWLTRGMAKNLVTLFGYTSARRGVRSKLEHPFKVCFGQNHEHLEQFLENPTNSSLLLSPLILFLPNPKSEERYLNGVKSSISQVMWGYLCSEGSLHSCLLSFKLHLGLIVKRADRSCSSAHRLWSQTSIKVWCWMWNCLLCIESLSKTSTPLIWTLGLLLKNSWLSVQSSISLRVVFRALKESKSSDFLFHQLTLPLITPDKFSPHYPFCGVLSRVTEAAVYFCVENPRSATLGMLIFCW